MSKDKLTLHVSDNPVYIVGKRKAIVMPVYKSNGENICAILLKLMCRDDANKIKTA